MTTLLGLPRSFLASLVMLLLVAAGACGGGAQELEGPVSVRVIVTAVQVSEDGLRVESIDVQTEDGKELSLRLSEEIEPAAWSPQHLQGHVELGKLGIQIGVKYKSDEKVATALFEYLALPE